MLHVRVYRNYILLGFSLVFYAWGEPVYIVVMLLSITMNYAFALLIDRAANRQAFAKFCVTVAIAANLAILVYFNYADFLIENINRIFSAVPGIIALKQT